MRFDGLPTKAIVALAAVASVLLVGGLAWVESPLRRLSVEEGAITDEPLGTAYFIELTEGPVNQVLAAYQLDGWDDRTPIFGSPASGAIYALAVSPVGDDLILSYTRDRSSGGSGLYRFDLEANGGEYVSDESALEPLTTEVADHVFTGLRMDPGGDLVWATLDGPETSSVIAIDVATGEVAVEIEDAVAPAVGDGWLAYLPLDADGSRPGVEVMDLVTGEISPIDVVDGSLDLGNLLADPTRDRLLATALIPPGESGIQLGQPASAHGAHDGPAQWLSIDLSTGEVERMLEHEPMGVRNATLLPNGAVVASTTVGALLIDDDVQPATSSLVSFVTS